MYYCMSKDSDISQSVTLRVVKVTTDVDRWEIGNAETAIHNHVGSYGDTIH